MLQVLRARPLQALQLSETRLSGSLPTELGQLAAAQHLLLDRASLSGTLPPQLGSCADLAVLSLEFNRLSGSLPLELGGDCQSHTRCAQIPARAVSGAPIKRLPRVGAAGDCSRASSYAYGPDGGYREPIPGTDLLEPTSDLSDGPRALHHHSLPAHLRRTAAVLRFRGNPGLSVSWPSLAATVPVDLGDLSSHDLCAYAAGPVQLAVAASGQRRELPGTIFRHPSPRAD